ncbi:MAG: hypothetical protein E7644_05860 [Ruminococcaceae bacterium]|nr:hypothetical protein [Oscillospiraceae bacterium]
MKRTLSLLLCLCLLAGALVCLTSCKKATALDLTGYQLVYDSSYQKSFASWADHYGKILSAFAGSTVKAGASLAETEAEVLLGHTNRPETVTMLAKIEGEGYAYGVINGKLVIVGTTNLMTAAAAEAFRAEHLEGKTGPGLTVKETVVSNAPTVEISGSYSVVYNADWDDDKGSNANAPTPEFKEENPDALDYGVVAAKQAREMLRKKVTMVSTSLPIITDKKEASEQEVLIGRLHRESSIEFIKTLGVEEYGVAMYGQQIVVSGHNENGLRLAMEMFDDLVSLGATTNEENRKVIQWPEGLRMVASRNFNWVLDVPTPEGDGIDLTGSVDVGEGSVEMYYTGSGVNADAFNAYCAGMAEKGYVLVQENEIEGSIFRTYRNTSTKVLLYTAYAAYTHAEEQGVTMFEPCIRVVTGKTTSVGNDFDDSLFTPALRDYDKVTDTRITGVRYDYDAEDYVSGNCYVMQLEDGSFIVMDGGVGASGEYTRLYNVLADLHKQVTGLTPSNSNPIRIAAWYLTHSHNDHYVTFVDMCKKKGTNLRVERLIANNASDIECYNCSNPNLYVRNAMSTISNYTQSNMEYIKVHTGMKLYIRNVELEVLYTHEDLYPQTLLRFNNTSTVVRATISSTDGAGNVQGTPTTALWLGDLEAKGSADLRSMYGSYVESDIVQIAHHGGQGCEIELYRLTKARILLWPCRVKSMKTYATSASASKGTSKYVSYHAFNMESVEYNIACDTYNLSITITKDGPNMTVGGESGLYDAHDRKTVVIGDAPGSAIVKMK